MKTTFSPLLTIILALCSYGQVVDLSGVVTNGVSGAPLKDVIVKLKSGVILDTTGVDGTYRVTNTAVTPGRVPSINKGSRLSGNFLEFSLIAPSSVKADVFTAAGVKIRTIIQNEKMAPGTYSVSVADAGLSPNIYFVRYQNGNETAVYKYFGLNRGQRASTLQTGFSNTAALSKAAAAALDTLVFSRSGFTPTNVAVTALTGVYNAVLQPLTNPVLEYGDIYCAIDSTDLALGRYRNDTLPLNIVLKNIGGSNALSVSCSLSTSDSNVLVTKPIGAYNNITQQDIATNFSPYLLVVSRRIPAAHPVRFALLIKDSWGGQWTDNCTVILNPFIVDAQVIDDDSIPDSKGNGDHLAAPGEIVEFTPRLQNKSGMTIAGTRGMLFSTVSGVAVYAGDDSWSYGGFIPDAKNLPEYDYVFGVGSTLKFYSDSIRFNLLARGSVNGVTRKWVVPVMVPVKPLTPSVPAITKITPGDSCLTVTWSASSGASSYNLYYKAGTTVDKATGTKVTGVTSPRMINGLVNGTQYAFAVSAVNAGGESGLSAVAFATPLAVPAVPVISSIVAGDSSVTVSWNPVLGATSYNLYYKIGNMVDVATGIKITGVTSAKIVAGLVNGTQYTFAISSVNVTGESELSVAQTVTPQLPIPSVPVISSAVAGDGSVTVSWSPVTGATSYNLYYTAGSTVTTSGTKVAGVTSPRLISGLTNSTQYAFALSAANTSGESGLSTIQIVAPIAPPSPPTIISAVTSQNHVTVTFSSVSGASSYNVYYKLGTTVDKISGTKATGTTSPQVVSGLVSGMQYAFAVSATNISGESGLSTILTATIPPQAPVISNLVIGDGRITVSWNLVAAAESYNIYYQKGNTVDKTTGTKLLGVTSPQFVANLTNGTRYAFAVCAVNVGGESVLSGVISATPWANTTITDICGYTYRTVAIGTQIWTVENLRTIKFNDGTNIPHISHITSPTTWATLTTPGFSNSSGGPFYNGYAVNTGKLAPEGWHVPTDSEWTVLTTFLGGESVAGGKLKGTSSWTSPNTGATNETGFSAYPGGCITSSGNHSSGGVNGFWWTSTIAGATTSWYRSMSYYFASVNRGSYNWNYGFCIRCIKD